MKNPNLNLIVVFALVAAMVAGVPVRTNAQGVEAQKKQYAAGAKTSSADAGWPNYGNDAGGNRFSPLSQVNRENVAQLKVAWTYHTGALDQLGDLKGRATFETTPILVGGRLYLSTPLDRVIALEPATGTKIWEFDPKIDKTMNFSEVTSRGVSAWRDAAAKAGQACSLRIFIGTIDARLIALDGATGKPCADFGVDGQVDLKKDVSMRDLGQYQVTSAPAIAGDVVITGSSIGDNRAVELERGIVRGFDARSGKQRWSWDPIPWASKSTPRTGAGNAWSTLSVDAEHGLVFVPTGSASPDYFGGLRPGDDKWANSVVALKAATGEFVWGFQVVHHDLWDYDVASQPVLFTWRDETPAVAITTKMGRVFVLNRVTGAPLLPVEERPAPKSDIPGEEAWPTQPASISLIPEKLNPEDAWGRNPEEETGLRGQNKGGAVGGNFYAAECEGDDRVPGECRRGELGSAAYDSQRHLLMVDTNRLAFFVRLIPREKMQADISAATTNDRLHGEYGRQTGAPFGMFRMPLLAPVEGIHLCNAPPWGTMAAVDLFTGKKAWDVPLGTFVPGMTTGTVTLGGPMATAGGLVFSAATMDNYIRAFDVDSGRELWAFELPAGGQATPMTYSVNGKQYVVIAAGGHGKLGTKQGDSVVAFTLP